MKLKPYLLLTLIATVVLTLHSCKKIQEDYIVKGLWELNGAYIDTFSNNQMNTFLPLYANGNDCCRYKVSFEDDNYVFAYYITYDSINYIAYGTWELLGYNKLYLKLDKYVDGEFDIKRRGARKFDMISEANHIEAFDGISPALDTTYTRLEVTKF